MVLVIPTRLGARPAVECWSVMPLQTNNLADRADSAVVVKTPCGVRPAGRRYARPRARRRKSSWNRFGAAVSRFFGRVVVEFSETIFSNTGSASTSRRRFRTGGSIVGFHVDAQTGALAGVGKLADVPAPQFVGALLLP